MLYQGSIFCLIVMMSVVSFKGNSYTKLSACAIGNENKIFSKIPKPLGFYVESSIDCSIQDKTGKIWFASNGEGLYSYDGKVFTHYTEKDGLDTGIIYCLLEDRHGQLWIGTKTGLNRYDGKTFTKIPILLNPPPTLFLQKTYSKNPPLQNGVWAMMEDSHGTIWLGTDAGVYCFNGIYFSSFLDQPNLINKNKMNLKATFSFLEDKKGHIWFTSCVDEGINRFDGKKLENIVPHNQVYRIDRSIEDKRGDIWFSAVFSGVCRYKTTTKQFEQNVFNEVAKNGPSSLVMDKSGKLWFNTKAGLGCYDGKTCKILTVKDGLPTNELYPILEDKNGNLWFSSGIMGLYCYNGKVFTKMSE